METKIIKNVKNSKPKSGTKGPASFSEQLHLLWQIQAIDTELSWLSREAQARPTLIGKLQKEIDSHQYIIQQESRLREETERKLHAAESDLKEEERKLKRIQANKKRSIKAEEIKRKAFTLSLTVTELKNEKTLVEDSLETTNKELLNAQTLLATQRQLAVAEETTLPDNLQRLSKLRSKHSSPISGDLLSTYERIRKMKGGTSIAPLRNKNCSGCNMLVPTQIHIEVRKAKFLITCPNCQRMLWWRSAD